VNRLASVFIRMIRLQCPKCERKLVVKPEFAGRVALCPGCQTKMRVPDIQAPADGAADAADAAEHLEENEQAQERSEQVTARQPRRREPADAADDRDNDQRDDELQDRPRKKKRRRKRKKKSFDIEALNFLGLDTITLIALGITLLGFLFIPAAFIAPPLIFVPLVLGTVISLAGYVWIIVIAFQDDSTQGMLCLCFGPYMLYYILVNFDEAKQAGMIWLAGTALQIAASVVAGANS
jgi:hypothetical protein